MAADPAPRLLRLALPRPLDGWGGPGDGPRGAPLYGWVRADPGDGATTVVVGCAAPAAAPPPRGGWPAALAVPGMEGPLLVGRARPSGPAAAERPGGPPPPATDAAAWVEVEVSERGLALSAGTAPPPAGGSGAPSRFSSVQVIFYAESHARAASVPSAGGAPAPKAVAPEGGGSLLSLVSRAAAKSKVALPPRRRPPDPPRAPGAPVGRAPDRPPPAQDLGAFLGAPPPGEGGGRAASHWRATTSAGGWARAAVEAGGRAAPWAAGAAAGLLCARSVDPGALGALGAPLAAAGLPAPPGAALLRALGALRGGVSEGAAGLSPALALVRAVTLPFSLLLLLSRRVEGPAAPALPGLGGAHGLLSQVYGVEVPALLAWLRDTPGGLKLHRETADALAWAVQAACARLAAAPLRGVSPAALAGGLHGAALAAALACLCGRPAWALRLAALAAALALLPWLALQAALAAALRALGLVARAALQLLRGHVPEGLARVRVYVRSSLLPPPLRPRPGDSNHLESLIIGTLLFYPSLFVAPAILVRAPAAPPPRPALAVTRGPR